MEGILIYCQKHQNIRCAINTIIHYGHLSTKLRCFAPSVINNELPTRPSTAMSINAWLDLNSNVSRLCLVTIPRGLYRTLLLMVVWEVHYLLLMAQNILTLLIDGRNENWLKLIKRA